ncbi:hypothetical protein LUX12_10675 [Streptomyces somaliensis]|uniref:hypothetical protein n=1 Tax=Streptomyces somaliensis TaxID=78355 RepID=UPI0020CF0F82|nr:hypothetical protein [Streptomyces somaliensis]MCP9945137.1 hypothetical protein [Streptomyces somaliensis]MCP9961640.1 hypothetical protein [Streptomyces somaliensis]
MSDPTAPTGTSGPASPTALTGATDPVSPTGTAGSTGPAGTTGSARAAEPSGGPRPEPLRFFGTTWVDHDGGYGLRRAGVAAGSLAAAVVGAFVLRLAYEGLALARLGGFAQGLVVVMFAVCTAVAFQRTWAGFGRRPADPAREEALRGLKAIGFLGSLLAHSVRCLFEAPGEKLVRAEYEAARARYEKRRATRAGDPAVRGKRPRR